MEQHQHGSELQQISKYVEAGDPEDAGPRLFRQRRAHILRYLRDGSDAHNDYCRSVAPRTTMAQARDQ